MEQYTAEELKERIDKVFNELPMKTGRMNESLHLELLSCTGGETTTVDFLYHLREEHKNPYGGLHGGVICTLFDTCAGWVAAALKYQFVTTTDMSVSFLRAMLGETFRIHIEMTHVGNRTVNAIGKIYNEDSGELCATGSTSYITIGGKSLGLQV